MLSAALLLVAPTSAYFAPVGAAVRVHSPAQVALPRYAVARRHPSPVAMDADESYRLLGVGEDSTYDEIEKAFDDLMLESASNAKRKIKLQIAKDKILDDRLSKSMSQLKSGRLSAPVNPFERPEAPKPLITIPPFLQPYMELPTKEDLSFNLIVFAIIGILPALSKSWASTSVGMGFALGLWKLYQRGAPPAPSDMEAAMRPPKPKPVIFATGITLLWGAIGATFSQVLYGMLRFMMSQELLISICTSMGFFVSSTLFKVQDE